MRKRSTPSSTSTGHTTSRNAAAMTRVPSDALGATFFEAKATAKWPMNTLSSLAEHGLLQVGVDRLVAEPDFEQRDEKILPGDELPPARAVDRDTGSRFGPKIQGDDRLLFCAANLVHHREERIEALPERRDLDLGMVGPHALLEGVGQLPCAEIAERRHRYALCPFQREHFGGAGLPFQEIERADVHLEDESGAHAGAVELQLGRADLDALVHVDSGDFRCERKLRTKHQRQDQAVHQALSYRRVRTNSRCPRVSAAVNRPFAVRNIISMSLSPAWSMLISLRVMPDTSTSMCSGMRRTVRGLAQILMTGRMGLPMTLHWPVGKKCTA